MVAPGYTTIIERLFNLLDMMLQNFINNGYDALANHLKYPLGLTVTLYIVLLGISIQQGWVKLSIGNLVKSALKIALIYIFAMNWGFFSGYAIKLISGGASELGAVLANATPISLPQFAGEGINGAMQSILIEFTRVGNLIWDLGSWNNWSPYFVALMTWGFGWVLLLIAVFELALAKVMLAILFVTAPLFVCFTLFKPTHCFFDRWLGAIVGFALVLIFISGILTLTLSMAQWTIADAYANTEVQVQLVGFVPAMFTCFLGIGILLKIAALAQQIGGAVSTSPAASLVAGAVGGFVGGTFAGIRHTATAARAGRSTLLGIGGIGRSMGQKIVQTSSHAMSAVNSIRNKLRGNGK